MIDKENQLKSPKAQTERALSARKKDTKEPPQSEPALKSNRGKPSSAKMESKTAMTSPKAAISPKYFHRTEKFENPN